jgi:hypothetical protein
LIFVDQNVGFEAFYLFSLIWFLQQRRKHEPQRQQNKQGGNNPKS